MSVIQNGHFVHLQKSLFLNEQYVSFLFFFVFRQPLRSAWSHLVGCAIQYSTPNTAVITLHGSNEQLEKHHGSYLASVNIDNNVNGGLNLSGVPLLARVCVQYI